MDPSDQYDDLATLGGLAIGIVEAKFPTRKKKLKNGGGLLEDVFEPFRPFRPWGGFW